MTTSLLHKCFAVTYSEINKIINEIINLLVNNINNNFFSGWRTNKTGKIETDARRGQQQ